MSRIFGTDGVRGIANTEPTSMFKLDNNAKKERGEQQKICEPIYSDITVPFEQIGSIKQESQTVSIQMTGDISLCCFWLR